MQHFYIISNKSRPNEYKFGIFNNNNFSRLISEDTYLSNKTECLFLCKIEKLLNYKLYDEIDKILYKTYNYIDKIEKQYDVKYLSELQKYLLKNGGGNELIKTDGLNILKKCILNDFPKLGLNIIKIYTNKDILNIFNKIYNDKLRKKNEDDNINNLLLTNLFNTKWQNRDYQIKTINYGINELKCNNKFYLDLATGGGKSYIIYNILSYFNSNIIICFSPRKIINNQNIKKDYIDILNTKYNIIKYPENKTFDNNIIISSCYQSETNLYDNLIKFMNLTKIKLNISVWFDEAHHTIENWISNISKSKLSKSQTFWLEDNIYIKNRIFSSASSSPDLIRHNTKYFGELYKPIKVNKLIELNWLCPIITKIFELNNNTNIINFILNEFKLNNCKYGFSYHSRCVNAFKLFNKHYNMYINNKTKIKPFLLININKELKDNNNYIQLNNQIKQIKKKINKKKIKKIIKIKLLKKYCYNYKDIVEFEKNENSIGYVVKKYDIGYDFKKLDFITFTDPKTSEKDIKQCIGRGLRPDNLYSKKSINFGKNKDKKLKILLPVYIQEEIKNKFYKIIEVLRYLILDIGLDIYKIMKTKIDSSGTKQTELNKNNYEGTDENKAIILDLLGYNINKTNQVVKFCINNNIKYEDDYNNFKKQNKYLKLKDNIYEYKDFKWKPIVDPNGELYYNTYEECLLSKKNIIKKLRKNKDRNSIKRINNDWFELCKFDNKIPINNLPKYFY